MKIAAVRERPEVRPRERESRGYTCRQGGSETPVESPGPEIRSQEEDEELSPRGKEEGGGPLGKLSN